MHHTLSRIIRNARTLLALAIPLCAFGSTGVARAQIVTNGGFESTSPLAPTGNFTTISAGQTGLTGWTIESGSVDVINTGYWQADTGAQSIDLDGSAAGTISQKISTIVGNKYTLTFAYANNYSTSAVETAMVTAVDTSTTPKTLFSASVSHSGSMATAMNYTDFTGTFIADTTMTTLRFASTDMPSSDQGIALDSIAVANNGAAAPEPSAACLALFGLLPSGLLLQKSRRLKL